MYKACVNYTNLHKEAKALVHGGKYMFIHGYTRRQTRLHEKAHAFALYMYLASDLYCIFSYTNCLKTAGITQTISYMQLYSDAGIYNYYMYIYIIIYM